MAKVWPYITEGKFISTAVVKRKKKPKVKKKRSKGKGSKIAKSGFKAEEVVRNAINSQGINYPFVASEYPKAKHAKCTKASSHKEKIDKVLLIELDEEKKAIGLTIKSSLANFNQADRGWVKRFGTALSAPDNIVRTLEKFVGYNIADDKKRFVFSDPHTNEEEFTVVEKNELSEWIESNKRKIVEFAICGAEHILSPDYMVIVNETKHTFIPIENVLKLLMGDVVIKRTTIHIGSMFSMQRKGGDSGAVTANQLQFKIKPLHVLKEYLSTQEERKI